MVDVLCYDIDQQCVVVMVMLYVHRPAVLVSLFPLLALAADVHSECSTSHKVCADFSLS